MKHTVNGFLCWRVDSYWEPLERITFCSAEPSEVMRRHLVVIRPHSIEVELPDDFDPRPAQIAALEAEKRELRAKFAARITEIDEQIGKLLAIEHTPEAA